MPFRDISTENRSILGKEATYFGLLLFLFISSFAIPVFFAARVGGFFSPEGGDGAPPGEADRLFPEAAHISPGVSIRLSPAEDLDPRAGEDFTIFGWFQLKRPPLDGQKVILLSKYEMETPPYPGYAVGVAKEGGALRPIVYWRSSDAKGQWFWYPEIAVPRGAWFMLALSFYQNRFLGLHTAVLGEGSKSSLRVLGGYDLDAEIFPHSQAALVVAPDGATKFKGRVAAFGVVRGEGLSENLEEALGEVTTAPLVIPRHWRGPALKFWTIDWKSDLSSATKAIHWLRNGKKSGDERSGKRSG